MMRSGVVIKRTFIRTEVLYHYHGILLVGLTADVSAPVEMARKEESDELALKQRGVYLHRFKRQGREQLPSLCVKLSGVIVVSGERMVNYVRNDTETCILNGILLVAMRGSVLGDRPEEAAIVGMLKEVRIVTGFKIRRIGREETVDLILIIN